jgi:hypothetical protein
MAILKVEQAILPQTLRLLLQLAERPDDVRFTHGIEGSEVHVPDELALEFLRAVEALDNAPSLNGHTSDVVSSQSAPSRTTYSTSTPSTKAKR